MGITFDGCVLEQMGKELAEPIQSQHFRLCLVFQPAKQSSKAGKSWTFGFQFVMLRTVKYLPPDAHEQNLELVVLKKPILLMS